MLSVSLRIHVKSSISFLAFQKKSLLLYCVRNKGNDQELVEGHQLITKAVE